LKIEDLRSMSEDELIKHHDAMAQNRASHYNIFLDELARREAMRQGKRMEALTTSINWLTWVITVATIVGVLLAAGGLIFGN
jgi:hypothetical protein